MDPFDTLLVRAYCEPHGNIAASVVETANGFELSSATSPRPISFESEAERQRVTGGDRSSTSVWGATKQLYDEDRELRARGCRACGPIEISGDLQAHMRALAVEAKRTGKIQKKVLRARRSC